MHLLCFIVNTISFLQLMEFWRSQVKSRFLNWMRLDLSVNFLQLFFVSLFLCVGETVFPLPDLFLLCSPGWISIPTSFCPLHECAGSKFAFIVDSLTYADDPTLSELLMGTLPGQSCCWCSNSVGLELLPFTEYVSKPNHFSSAWSRINYFTIYICSYTILMVYIALDCMRSLYLLVLAWMQKFLNSYACVMQSCF